MAVNLKKKVGPLPLWVWIAAVGAGAVVWYIRKKSAGTATTPTTPDGSSAVTYPTAGDLTGASGAGGAGLPDAVTGGGTYPTPAQEIADVTGLAQGLGDLYSSLPYAPAGSAQQPSTGSTGVSDLVQTIKDLQEAGLIAPAQSQGTAAQASKPRSHVTAGFHPGHSRGHDYFLPGTGWVSRARYLASTVAKPRTKTGTTTAPSATRPVQRTNTPVRHVPKPKKKSRRRR